MFVAFDRRVRIHLGVVALGTPPRLQGCLEALVAHDFAVSVLNPVTVAGRPTPQGVPRRCARGVRRILLPWDTDELPVDVRAYLPKF